MDQLVHDAVPGAVVSHGAKEAVRTVVDVVVEVHLLGQGIEQLYAVAVVVRAVRAVRRLVLVDERRDLNTQVS